VGRGAPMGDDERFQACSTISAIPWPTLMHMVARP
jgi:hypothetical protein